MGAKSFVLKGNICYSKSQEKIEVVEQGYLVCVEGISQGVFQHLPEKYAQLELEDCGDRLIIPGLVDLHIHAPQYAFRGLGMDMELLDWLETHTFPEESKYADLEYAKKAYKIFVDDMMLSGTTRAAIFGTIHKEATELLMDLLEDAGLKCYVGKLNMDRNCPDYYREESAEKSIEETVAWLDRTQKKYKRTKPILTPRFIPTCSDEVMQGLGRLQKMYQVPMQSHLSENYSEIAWVQELCPQSGFYGNAYNQAGLFGKDVPTIMAHCVHSTREEMDMMKAQGVFIAHCPQSNTNIASGIAPVRQYLEEGQKIGLGSDIAGGSSMSIFRAMVDAIQASNLRWRLVDQEQKMLTVDEAFYLGTKGGGEFFGKVGSFEPGYELDALILDDSELRHPQPLTVKERLERMIYLSDERHIVGKYVAGESVW